MHWVFWRHHTRPHQGERRWRLVFMQPRERFLNDYPDVSDFSVTLDTQEVIVKSTTATYEDILAKIKKTGKEVRVDYSP
jgi:hypothetical protein